MYDVARHAGVSTATVSRSLNGIESVDPALSARVMEAVAALGYKPNGVARNLRRQTTLLWMLLISDIENPFFTAVARGVEDIAQSAGYSLVLCNSDEDLAKEKGYIDGALNERAAGVLLAPASGDTDITPLLDQGVPVVVFDRALASDDVDSVVTDSMTPAFDATVHLLDMGWRRVACITGPRYAATAEQRVQGYEKALRTRRHGTPLIYESDFRASGGRRAAASLLDGDDVPDAFFVANNLMALGVLAELSARGLMPGRDVGIVSFDDPPWAELLDPPLSVIAQPAYELGRTAARLLQERASGTYVGRARHELLTCEFKPRESSRRRTG